VRIVRVVPRAPLPEPVDAIVGAVLARDVVVAGERWRKGRRLDLADLARLAASEAAGSPAATVTLLLPDPGEIHEDEAARRLAAAVAGPGLQPRGPAESRIDLVATAPGIVRVRTALLARVAAIDGIAVFTVLDGQAVAAGALVASVKTGPHLVPESAVARAEALARQGGLVIEVRPYRRRRVAAIVKEALLPAARVRFEAGLRSRVEGLGSELAEIAHVADDAAAVAAAFRRLTRGATRADLILTAGAGSTDPSDAMFVGFAATGGRIVSHGVPAHPGSMLWLGRAARTTVLGLPTCGAFSRATAADLLLPWLLAGEPPTRRTVARLAHGGILTREMRFRFPPYARELDQPDG
jgi:molybdenum cofactor cytidylyltransferase